MPIDVLTNRYDNSRAGVNRHEDQLVKAKINTRDFGKLFSRTVDGDLYAQPLIVSDLRIDGIKRNVVYLATSRNLVYAFDADDPLAYLPLWTRSLGLAVPRDAIYKHYLNFASEVGVTSTPVIQRDGKGGTIFLVAKSSHFTKGGQRVFQYTLHALNILTGKDVKEPVLIEAAVKNAARKLIELDPQLNLNRPGLLLHAGVIYIAFGSQGDFGEFYGWILAYSAKTLTQIAVYNTAPDWGQGGVWQSGTGLACDAEGFVYAAVGNGEKAEGRATPVNVAAPVYGNALLKLKLEKARKSPAKFQVADWFTASNVFELNENDDDFTGGPVLFEANDKSGKRQKLLLGGGKDGKFYLANRNKLGGWVKPIAAAPGAPTAPVQNPCNFHIHGAPVVWQRSKGEIRAFVWSEKDSLKSFVFDGSSFGTKPISKSKYCLPENENRMPGGVLALSWNGHDDDTAVIWATHPTSADANNKTVPGTLRAYDALNLEIDEPLWWSDMDPDGSDKLGCLAKFSPPVVANGKVYVGTFSRELVVYGLFEELLPANSRVHDTGIFELRNIGEAETFGTYLCGKYELQISGRGIDKQPVKDERGNEIPGQTQDEFVFANVERNMGPGSIQVTSRLDAIDTPQNQPDAIAGVMIRRDTRQGAKFAAVVISKKKENDTTSIVARFLYREDDNAPFTVIDCDQKDNLPIFIRIIGQSVDGKVGWVKFWGEISKNSSDWKIIGEAIEIRMDPQTANMDLKAGLMVSAETGSRPDTVGHATFSLVDIP
jgi:outer membrane protein assembly factor BamB